VILDHMDTMYGMPTAVRNYVHALRDLQYGHNESAYSEPDFDPDLLVDRAKARIVKAFDELAACHYAMVEGREWKCWGKDPAARASHLRLVKS
jgi:hypothetical protein